MSKYNMLVNHSSHLPSYILKLSCIYFTTGLAQSYSCGFVMSFSQTVRPFIYCMHLVYIHYHVSILS
jgi:hypothetical protein